MDSNLFLGVWYSPMFHIVTGNLFLILTIVSTIISCVILWTLLGAIDYVGNLKHWRSCTPRETVKHHLYGVFAIMFLSTLIILYIMWMDFGLGWEQISHKSHILHYSIWFVFTCMIGWAHRSKNHFKSLGDCAGSFTYWAKLKRKQTFGEILPHNKNEVDHDIC